MYRFARSSPTLLKQRSLCWQHGRDNSLRSDAALLASGLHSPRADTPLLAIGLPNLYTFPDFGPASNVHSYALSNKYFASPHLSLRHFCRSCDEDIDKKSSPLASADAGKDEVDEPKKIETTKEDCELSPESESTNRSRLKESSQEQICAVPPPEEKEQEHVKAQQEDVGGKPVDNEKKKGNGKLNPLKMKFKKLLISWDKIHETFENFPYYLNKHTKDLLIESAAAQLWHHKQTKFGNSLRTSSRLVLLTGPPGTEIYQEKLVRALAKQLKTSLLILDSDVLAAQKCKQETHDTSADSGGEIGMISPEGSEIWTINTTDDEDANDEEEPSNKKAVSAGQSLFQTLGLVVKQREKPKTPKVAAAAVHVSKSDDDDSEEEESQQSDAFKIGDHVRFIDSKASKGAKKRGSPRVGQQGLVMSVTKEFPEAIGVKFERASSRKAAGSQKENRSCLVVCDVKQLEKVDAKCPEEVPWMAPIEAFAGLGPPPGGTIVYFPDLQKWMAKAVSRDEKNFFLHTLADHLDSSKGPVIFITGRRKEPGVSNNNGGQWNALKSFLSSMRGPFRRSRTQSKAGESDTKGIDELYEIFKNVVPILPPQDHEALRQWREQLHQDTKELQLRNNVLEIEKVLSANAMSCNDVAKLDFSDLLLTEKQAQKIVGWARNIFLSSNEVQHRGKTLFLSRESLELAVTRFRAIETTTDKLNDIKSLAENEYESELASSVVRAKDIGVSFDQIGALEDVKTTLKELIILPLKRPELFNKGNLRKPCKGVLLFGPPGTGKTLLAKAVATEAGANFMSINASSLTCKYFGESEKLAKSLFTLARKLEPAIIFIDEVDGILRARGDATEHEASRRVRNELMAAWDGLQTKDRERILVLATTNRPFDLDDAVIRRLPRRIFIDLPDSTNREKILHKLLMEEDLVKDFDFKHLAAQTDGFSGSDLKNLCVAAAYRPIQEFLDAEKQGKDEFVSLTKNQKDSPVSLRDLCLDDFIQAKVKVGMSVAYDASSMVQMRQWNEQFGEGGSRVKSAFGFIN